MKKKNFHLVLITLSLIVSMAILKWSLPTILPSQGLDRRGKANNSSGNGQYESSNNSSFFQTESTYNSNGGEEKTSEINAIESHPSASSGGFSSGMFNTTHNESSHEDKFTNDIGIVNTMENTNSNGGGGGGSDMGIGLAIPSLNIPLISSSEKDKDKEEKEKTELTKTNLAQRNSFFSGSDQIMATPPPPPPTPQMPLDDYYLAMAAACAIFGTIKLFRQTKNVVI